MTDCETAAQVTNCCETDPCDIDETTITGGFQIKTCEGGTEKFLDPDALSDAAGCTDIEFMVRQAGQWVKIDIATLKACLTPTMCEIQDAE